MIQKDMNPAIVGNPNIGKTSLINKIAEHTTFFSSLDEKDRNSYALVEIDFQLFKEVHQPDAFWQQVIQKAIDSNETITQPLKELLDVGNLNSFALFDAFKQISRQNGHIIIFLDEFDYLFNFSNFYSMDFLGPLRTIVMKCQGISLVTASRLSVAQMNELAAECKATRGSDMFNYLYQVELGTFSDDITKKWLSEKEISDILQQKIKEIAGNHPLLIHIAGQLIGDLLEETDIENPVFWEEINRKFIQKADSQFQDIWRYLSEKAQIALVIFALRDLAGKVGKDKFNLEQTEKVIQWYKASIEDMVQQGTLDKDKKGNYIFGSSAFQTWIVQQKIEATRGEEPQEAFTKWLHAKQFKLGGLVTNEEIAFLQQVWQSIPKSILELALKYFTPTEK